MLPLFPTSLFLLQLIKLWESSVNLFLLALFGESLMSEMQWCSLESIWCPLQVWRSRSTRVEKRNPLCHLGRVNNQTLLLCAFVVTDSFLILLCCEWCCCAKLFLLCLFSVTMYSSIFFYMECTLHFLYVYLSVCLCVWLCICIFMCAFECVHRCTGIYEYVPGCTSIYLYK